MDKVFIEGLAIDTVIGVYDWEREIKQTLVIDLEMGWSCRNAGETDNLNDALNYAAVSEAIIQLVESSSYQLIESVAERIASLVLSDFKVHSLTLKVSKPGAVPTARNVAVKIHREAN